MFQPWGRCSVKERGKACWNVSVLQEQNAATRVFAFCSRNPDPEVPGSARSCLRQCSGLHNTEGTHLREHVLPHQLEDDAAYVFQAGVR